MKKLLLILGILGLSLSPLVVFAASISDITAYIPNPTFNQYYSTRVRFQLSDPAYNCGPNVDVNGLPPGLAVKGYSDTIYCLNQKDAGGYYYIDIAGTPYQAGHYNIQVYLFDATHTFDFNQNYSIEVAAPPVITAPFIRLYNRTIDDHFYTVSMAEAQTAVSSGYIIEGTIGRLYISIAPDTDVVYRMYSSRLHKHFYTTNFSEMTAAQASGFTLEGTIGSMPSYGITGADNQVYRLLNPRSIDHVYTIDARERDAAMRNGYILEGNLGGRLLNN